jgi:L-histidine N-alpha-methyltransferase
MRDAGTLRRYIPLDVSQSVVEDAARTLIEDYEDLQVYGVVGDFERHLEHVPHAAGVARLVALLGGTIGNFPPGTRRNVLNKIAGLLGPEDRLLLGTDLVKDPHVIEAAYNDAAGITAEFNRNLLYVLNRELDADFQPESFEHIAFYDRRNEWVEMRLRATRAMSAYIADLDLRVEFAAGEELRTEISAKFTRAHVEADLEAAGLELDRWFTDEENLFAITMARPQTDSAG